MERCHNTKGYRDFKKMLSDTCSSICQAISRIPKETLVSDIGKMKSLAKANRK